MISKIQVKNFKCFKETTEFEFSNISKQVFELHIKSMPNKWRIHFYLDADACYIGYIGKHLRTASEN